MKAVGSASERTGSVRRWPGGLEGHPDTTRGSWARPWTDPERLRAEEKGNVATECAYADCTKCKGDLYAVVQIERLVPSRVLDVGREENWPEGHYR